MFAAHKFIVLVSFISPAAACRSTARSLCAPYKFFEIFVRAKLKTCIDRDPKGLYRRAQSDPSFAFTGVSAPYETPRSPDLILDTDRTPVNVCVGQLLKMLALNKSFNNNTQF
jgi:adenylylsulfate kinase